MFPSSVLYTFFILYFILFYIYTFSETFASPLSYANVSQTIMYIFNFSSILTMAPSSINLKVQVIFVLRHILCTFHAQIGHHCNQTPNSTCVQNVAWSDAFSGCAWNWSKIGPIRPFHALCVDTAQIQFAHIISSIKTPKFMQPKCALSVWIWSKCALNVRKSASGLRLKRPVGIYLKRKGTKLFVVEYVLLKYF